jgi:hypothetical protein
MAEQTRPSRLWLVSLASGVAIGVAATIALPRLLGPRLPAGLAGEEELLEGIVRSKQLEADRLLLTVPTQHGTLLATFTEDLADINLLVQEGDSVTLEVRRYEPFVRDPPITRVVAARFNRQDKLSEVQPTVVVEPDTALDTATVEIIRDSVVPAPSPAPRDTTVSW